MRNKILKIGLLTLLAFFVFATPAFAVDTLVETSVSTNSDLEDGLWGPYWSNKDTGVIIFSDDGDDLSMARTIDGGANWATTELLTGTVRQMAVFFDKEVPGDDGDLVHIAWLESSVAPAGARYMNINVDTGAEGTIRVVDGVITPSGTPHSNRIAITKTVSGNIIVAGSTQLEIFAHKSDDLFVSTSTIADVFETATEEDWLLMYPADTGDDNDAVGIFWDRDANTISIKMYDDSVDDWTETSISGGMVDDAQQMNMDGAVRHSDSHILFVAHQNDDDAGDDLLAWDLTVDDIDTPTSTAKTNIFTDQAESAQTAIIINQQNDDVYVAHLKGGVWAVTIDVVYHKSDDGMATWGAEQAYSEASADNNKMVKGGRSITGNGGRIQWSWFNDDLNDIFVNLVNDIEIKGDTLVSTVSGSSDLFGQWGPYWVDEDTALIIGADGGNDLNVFRTTDGGSNWAKTEDWGAGNVRNIAVFFDKEVPNDSGDKVHIAWADTTDSKIYYANYDVATDTAGTKRTVDGTVTVGNIEHDNRIAIGKTVSGNILIAGSTQTEIFAYKSDDEYVSTSTIADVFETPTEEDWVWMYPADTGDDNDAVAIFWDRNLNILTMKMYDDSGDLWDETGIGGDMGDDLDYAGFDGAIRHSDAHLLIAAHSNNDSSTDDLRTWDITVDSIATPTSTQKTNIFTDQVESTQVGLIINQQTDDVYVCYLKGGTWRSETDAVYHKSDDGMGSWGSEEEYSQAVIDDIRTCPSGRTVGNDGGRIQFSFYNDDLLSIFVNENNDIEITAAEEPAPTVIRRRSPSPKFIGF